jgi:hypothetical protein
LFKFKHLSKSFLATKSCFLCQSASKINKKLKHGLGFKKILTVLDENTQ